MNESRTLPRPHRWLILFLASTLLLGALPVAAWATSAADSEEVAVEGFSGVVRRPVTFWSDGTRLAGDLFYPGQRGEEKVPAIVLCHGWGGTKQHLNQHIAPRFASHGFAVLAFDYRGWGESDSRLVVEGEMPEPDADGMVTVRARAVRQIVDPVDQQQDIDAAITFVEGEPMVDAARIGIWGSSFGGGHVIWRAAHDERVKAVVAQVGAMDQRLGISRDPGLEEIHQQHIRQVRGEAPPVPTDADKPEGLTGTPYYARFVDFVPVDVAEEVEVPVLIIDAEQEHYFDIAEHGGKVYERIKDRVPSEYLVWDIRHYDIYRGEHLDRAMEAEAAWFEKHLKD